MKELHARAGTPVNASAAMAMALLEAIDGYPRWYPEGVRTAEILERDSGGRPTQVQAVLHVATGPLTRDFHLTLAVTRPEPGSLRLTRVPHDSRDQERFTVTWRVSETSGVRVELSLDANLSVPRLVPVGGVGESIAKGFLDAAARALR
jgi:Polyketide cyclase / dehydrase and lipid transport